MFSSVSSFVASKASGDKSASLPTTPLLISTLSSNFFGWSRGHLQQTKTFWILTTRIHLAEHYYFGRDRTLASRFLRPVLIVEDDQLTHNACRGKCLNKEIAIEYEYDLRASWEVHITLDKDDEIFTVNPPNNLPMIVKAKGADAKDKTIPPLLSDAENFQLYCDEKFQTRAGEEELECQFCGMREEDISALQQQRQANTKTKSKRPAEEEEDSDDEDTDDEDELRRCIDEGRTLEDFT
ncbi:hypothetical protein GG344DRAFT_65954 [Lentinula edodes]|nr:hypothetical protein GG344DRAFT_65954 [Lentinula edodes]